MSYNLRNSEVFLRLLGFVLLLSSCVENEKQPNIILVLVDDLCYSDVGYIGTEENNATPYIDALRRESMLFSNAYAASPVCSPTCASLLTGKYPATLQLTSPIRENEMARFRQVQDDHNPMMDAMSKDRLPLDEITIAEALKEVGYHTAFFGKWHLVGGGDVFAQRGNDLDCFNPECHGFDVSSYSTYNTADDFVAEYEPNCLTDEALKYMYKQKNVPFFCMLSYSSVSSSDNLCEQKGIKESALVKLDRNIGRLMSFLKTENLDKNTFVVFCSSNGGEKVNPPFKGKKGSLFEGGIRVPFLIKYPPLVSPNTTNEVPITSPDLFPTILDVAGVYYQENACEGQSLYPLLSRQSVTLNPRSIYWHFPHHYSAEMSMAAAIRKDEWKLIYEFEGNQVSLFYLVEDPYECYNLSFAHKQVANKLLKELQEWQVARHVAMPKVNPNY